MAWLPIPDSSDDEVGEALRLWRKKARFLVDESLGKELAEAFDDLGWNTVTVWDRGIEGQSDEAVFAAAWRERRILLTKDRDFLDDHRFPEHRNPGVIVLPDGPIDGAKFLASVFKVHDLIAPLSRAYLKTKIDLSNPDAFTVKSRDSETGAMTSRKYRVTVNGEIQMWQEEQRLP